MKFKLFSILCSFLLLFTLSAGCIDDLFDEGEVIIIVNNMKISLDKVELNITFHNELIEDVKVNYTDFKLYDVDGFSYRCRGPRNLPKVKIGKNATFEIFFDTPLSSMKFLKLKYINSQLSNSFMVDLEKRGVMIAINEKVEVVNDCYLNITLKNNCGRTLVLNHLDFKLLDANNKNYTSYGPKDLWEIENKANSTFDIFFDVREKNAAIQSLIYNSEYVDKPVKINID